MAEDYIEMETSSKIPVLHRGKEIAVGFNDLGSIQPLDELLSRYFPKKIGKTIDKNLQELSVNVKKYVKLSDLEKKERKVSFDKIASAVNNINNAIKEDRNRKKSDRNKEESNNKAVGAKIAQAVAKATISSLQLGFKRIESLRELESAGVAVTGGFDRLRKASEDLARPIPQLSKLYAKNSQLLSRLNASTKFANDGVGFFNDTLKSVSGQFNLTRQEEEAILSEYLDTRTKYANIEQLDRERLRKETELYTKNLKQLSMATGKSIDLILQENKLKEDEFSLQTLRDANPAIQLLESLLTQQIGPELARAYILNDVKNKTYLGSLATQQGRDYAQLRKMAIMNPNMSTKEMVSFINASLDRNQTERNRMRQAIYNDAAYGSGLVYGDPTNNVQFGMGIVTTRGQKLADYDFKSEDGKVLTSARNFSDEIERMQIILENIRTQSLQNVGKELDFFADKLKIANEGLSYISRLKDKLSDNYWADLVSTAVVGASGGLLIGLGKTVGSTIVSGITSTIGNSIGGIGNLFGNFGKSGINSKLGNLFSLKSGSLGIAGRMAGTAIEGGMAINNFANGDYLGGTKDALKAGLWSGGIGWGLAGEAADWIGTSLGEGVAKIQQLFMGGTLSDKEREELKRKNEELFKKRQQFLQSSNTVPPAQPSFDSSSNTSASNASTQNAETQRFNATNQVQKDIKEINSLMLDALERIERGQQRQTQQLENIGFMATSKNTGMI